MPKRLLYSLTHKGSEILTPDKISTLPLNEAVVLARIAMRASGGVSSKEIKDSVRLPRPVVDRSISALKTKDLIFNFTTG